MISSKHPNGQTLIETLAAIFILTMGVTAGVGLADYALGTSTSITKQVIATGLAREGIEAVKNMRDTNWLQAGAINTNCYDYASSTAFDADCYKTWLTQNSYGTVYGFPGSIINPPSNNTPYVLTFGGSDLISNQGSGVSGWHAPYVNWGLYQANSSSPATYLCITNSLPYTLDFNNTPASSPNFGAGYYAPSCNPKGTSGFYRKITLQVLTAAPFNNSDSSNDLAELYVKSQVWWVDNKRCGASADWPGAGKCSVEIDTYLTNWKTY